jgi:quinol monooxygenase YgiN
MFVRLSRGRFAADKFQEMADRLQAAEEILSPAIRALPGLIEYYAGIDAESSTMIRVSVWDKAEHAEQISKLPEILRLRSEFEQAGVQWEPVNTYSVAWWVQSA